VIPLPPFGLEIITSDKQEIHSPLNFAELDLSLIQDHTWENEGNVEIIPIDLTFNQYGFKGSARVGVISKDGKPVKEVEVQSKDVLVDGQTYTLSCHISYADSCIMKHTNSIEVEADGQIQLHTGHSNIAQSKGELSIHGIKLPYNPFSYYVGYGEKAILHFPFPIIFRLDIGGDNDLNLNSARTQIIYDDKWLKFEKGLFTVVCLRMRDTIGLTKWVDFKHAMIDKVSDAEMLKVLEGI
jgi:hypothetical protein